jgi:hypothetical protein
MLLQEKSFERTPESISENFQEFFANPFGKFFSENLENKGTSKYFCA